MESSSISAGREIYLDSSTRLLERGISVSKGQRVRSRTWLYKGRLGTIVEVKYDRAFPYRQQNPFRVRFDGRKDTLLFGYRELELTDA